ncbi:MAG TPA: hypothetical protein VJU77_15795 [Chthoniobacterales bacterium]|nr:hypothetical protein [Chthoniobacterales bacterium]
MHRRLIAILAATCLAFGGAGCASKSNKDYDEILMPAQTGSVLQRRVQVKKIEPEEKPKKKKDKEKPSSPKPKPDEEPSAEATPKPEPESTPPTERFR